MENSDLVIVGGGIIGLATAMTLQERFTDAQVTVVEAEKRVGEHQTGHNSGVLHAGIYYKPGSRKAINCRTGKLAMEAFCSEHSIPWDRCGKVVVATTEEELPRLDQIAQRATENGVAFERIDTDRLRELEPSAAGLAALHVPETGIVNYRKVCETMSEIVSSRGGNIRLSFEVAKIDPQASSVQLTSRDGETISCDRIVNCAGLNSDRVCRMAGGQPNVRIVPFRGEYYELVPESESLCRNLIYPVPDPSFPFLGVHFTRMIDGGVECGPNAVLALSREGYRWRDVSVRDMIDTFSYKGFRTLAAKHWRMGLGEMHRSLRKTAFVTALQKLIPAIRSRDLKPGRAGVRAQAVTPDGNLYDDFLIEKSDRAIHVLNAPSPAATASIAIANQIVDELTAVS
jgi:L-2-hydroxyglutarate oxidase